MFFTWRKITNPGLGNIASKTGSWTADSFSGGLTIDFSAVVPAGTKAVMAVLRMTTTASNTYARKYNDANISNTPDSGNEDSHIKANVLGRTEVLLWLSDDVQAQIAVADALTDIYISYPEAYLI